MPLRSRLSIVDASEYLLSEKASCAMALRETRDFGGLDVNAMQCHAMPIVMMMTEIPMALSASIAFWLTDWKVKVDNARDWFPSRLKHVEIVVSYCTKADIILSRKTTSRQHIVCLESHPHTIDSHQAVSILTWLPEGKYDRRHGKRGEKAKVKLVYHP